jgi:hypothetical protein
VVNSLVNLLGYPHDRGLREHVKYCPSEKLPRLLERVHELTSTDALP